MCAWRIRYNSLVARVLMVSSEAAPWAKTGGLADVVGALPAALRDFGDEAAVVIPRYGSIDLKGPGGFMTSLPIHLGRGPLRHRDLSGGRGVPALPGGLPALFDRKGFYGESGTGLPR